MVFEGLSILVGRCSTLNILTAIESNAVIVCFPTNQQEEYNCNKIVEANLGICGTGDLASMVDQGRLLDSNSGVHKQLLQF